MQDVEVLCGDVDNDVAGADPVLRRREPLSVVLHSRPDQATVTTAGGVDRLAEGSVAIRLTGDRHLQQLGPTDVGGEGQHDTAKHEAVHSADEQGFAPATAKGIEPVSQFAGSGVGHRHAGYALRFGDLVGQIHRDPGGQQFGLTAAGRGQHDAMPLDGECSPLLGVGSQLVDGRGQKVHGAR
jgi:hypothetical protein